MVYFIFLIPIVNFENEKKPTLHVYQNVVWASLFFDKTKIRSHLNIQLINMQLCDDGRHLSFIFYCNKTANNIVNCSNLANVATVLFYKLFQYNLISKTRLILSIFWLIACPNFIFKTVFDINETVFAILDELCSSFSHIEKCYKG